MTIHTTHPFADAEPDPVRRLRGRLGGAVTLWTAGDGATRAGLTVSSLMVALGPTPTVLALLDPDADLTDELRDSGRAVLQLLSWGDRQLAEAFAGTAPAPGGPFRQAAFEQTAWGPRLASATTWAGLSLVGEREAGWSVEVSCAVDHAEIGDDPTEAGDTTRTGDRAPLLHRRGRFLPG
jgi:flavin reductase (DIM6/NTAB) family NADH-FMN oxidoreductase RutF